ncbi:putative NRPS-like protein biosynthetic cluster [Malassezia nana]|uniref:NRPS-like protein biosynthetic cluster n=1 Tax=Malassezia nana TaxID=180528 RepID=A0AAF0ELI3_9BASI|nr:putative NRPS-like protein biosynthetic cluster [Malassezia nana]
MEHPLSYVLELPPPQDGVSLGDYIAANVTDNGKATTLIDCLPSTNKRALISPDLSRPPLTHRMLKQFITSFVLPSTVGKKPLQLNDRVMMALPTGPENALALLAIASYYNCAPVNASCTADELKDDALRLGARAVISTQESIERLGLDRLHNEHGLEIYLVEPRPSGPAGLFDISMYGQEDPASRHRSPSTPNNLKNQALVLHTSGTSGKKKVVPYTLRHLIVGAVCVMQSWNLHPEQVNMNMMPLFHVGGILRNLWAPVLSGGSTILCSGFDANAWWTLATQLGATWYYAAPTMHHAILASKPPEVDPATQLQIKMICNAAGGLLPSLANELRATFNCTVLPSYGMTECMPIASPPITYQLERPGCSGIACGPEISIRDPLNIENELEVGKTGNICVRGLPTFSGYEVEGTNELDSSMFSSEGWFDTGDCGHLDQDGYLYITGRSKEIINKGGEVVSPFEVEEAITQACKDRVKQTLCFSIEHKVLQETIGVVIVPQPNQPRIGLSELQNSLRSHLHPSKWPFAIVYMDDLPKNQAGKPLRIKLGSRLGIGPLSDDVPAMDRHFEAKAPSKDTPLSRPIPCSRITVDVRAVQRACYRIPGVLDAAVVQQRDRSPMAFIQVQEDAEFDASDIDRALGQILHGYVVPNPLHVFRQPLIKTNGEYDFAAMENIVREQNAASMSQTSIIVRDIIAKLLDLDTGSITDESDFFLLGGNSLLLGRLIFMIRKETDVSLEVSTLFINSTVSKIAALIDEQRGAGGAAEEEQDFYQLDEKGAGLFYTQNVAHDYNAENDPAFSAHGYKGRSATSPLVLFVQAIPFIFFYPLKAAWTWTIILHGLAFFAYYIEDSFWERLGALLASIVIARITSRIICPAAAIAFKWVVIGRYRPGKYPMWSNYHLRWWIVNQSLRTSGRGVFALSSSLMKLYFRLLGMQIGKGVQIDSKAKIWEHDLITIHDRAVIDRARIRGFCVERDGFFRLEPIVIGRDCVVNTYTQISPGARLADGTVWGPQSSSHEAPSPDSYAAFNRMSVPQPHILLRLLIGYPIVILVRIISYVPWFAALFLLLAQPFNFTNQDSLHSIIAWYAYPKRIGYHFLARIVRKILPPLINVVCGLIIKRVLGLNKAGSMRNASQLVLFRRWMSDQLLNQYRLKRAFEIIGTHYEMVSVVYRVMGAKIGKRVYWPGSGIYCPDPELLEIGDDVVFGSRSEVFTSDSISFDPVRIGRGAMIADRVVLLPGSTVGVQCVMGSGALSRRNGNYEDRSVWMGSKNGEAVSFGKSQGGPAELGEDDTITPFGRAYYKRQANYFVMPYLMIVALNVLTQAVSAAYWAGGFAATVVSINRIVETFWYRSSWLFNDHWYRPAFLYLAITIFFIVILPCQAIIALGWVVGTKWMLIGRRREGKYNWDMSSYCQRWQTHLTLQKPAMQGFGGHIFMNLSGTAYVVWYLRALGARIGKDCAIWASGKPTLQLTEPDLVTMGDRVSIDDCSVVAHINSRGQFSLNRLRIGDGCAMRTGSRLLSGASMEAHSMLLEHTLVASGEITESWAVYGGWPARRLKLRNPAPAKA